MPRARASLTAFLFLLPNLVGFLAFTAGPVLAAFLMTFFTGDFTTRLGDGAAPGAGGGGGISFEAGFVGLANYERLARDEELLRYLGNTLFLMGTIPINVAFSLGLALLLNQGLRGTTVYRTIFFLPTISSGIALFLIWRWIYSSEVGLLNAVLASVGIDGPSWLSDAAFAKPALMIMGLWIGMGGYNMVLYLAGLQDIDPALYEAAAIDGAGPLATFRHITWPQLAPTTFFIVVTNVIGGFQVFDQAYVMTGGGPEGATTTLVYYIYDLLYIRSDAAYAATVAVALFGLIFAVTVANWYAGRKLASGAAPA